MADSNDFSSYEKIKSIADDLMSRTKILPKIGIICGSGLGQLADYVSEPDNFDYASIPSFPVSTVEGHVGALIFGKIDSVPVVLMQGRFHMYEGYSLDQVTLPVRVMKLMGVQYLIVTNAAGSLNPKFKVGDIMLVRDHLNWPGFAGNSPLRGTNDERFGPRFPPVVNAYNVQLRDKAKEVAKTLGIEKVLHEGVYSCVGGPNYESIAELRMLSKLGADAVGMSTAHEVVAAVHCDMKVFAFSLITNECPLDYEHKIMANHEEVMSMAKSRQNICGELVRGLVRAMAL